MFIIYYLYFKKQDGVTLLFLVLAYSADTI